MAKIKFVQSKNADQILKPAAVSGRIRWKRRAIMLLGLLLSQSIYLIYLLRVTNL